MGYGQCVFDPVKNRYLIDLAVTARYDSASAGDVLKWQNSFRRASLMLFAATLGQMQLGKLYFLDDGSAADEEDIYLRNATGSSFTTSPVLPFHGHVHLKNHVRFEPLITIHELGHYVATLADEYRVIGSSVTRECQSNPATLECPMEYARGFGVLLDEFGNPAPAQPDHLVSQFCFGGHVASLNNHQHQMHSESCWETLARIYDLLVLPDGRPPLGTLEDIDWIERPSLRRYALAIASSDWFSSVELQFAVRNAAKEWVTRFSVTDDQISLDLGGPQGIRTPMQPIGTQDRSKLLGDIDSLELVGTLPAEWLTSLTTRFPNSPAAYQRLVLFAPANANFDLSGLAARLASQRIQLVALTFGTGRLPVQLAELSQGSKWVTASNVPIENNEQGNYAFGLQNELIELYYASSPGYGLANFKRGRLPKTLPGFTPLPEELVAGDGQFAINLEERESGVDIPVWIEEGAESAIFLLSLPAAKLCDFSLLTPAGTIVEPTPARQSGPSILSLDVPQVASGRWIARIRRRVAGDLLPFSFLVAVRNRALSTTSRIDINKRNVKLRFMAEYFCPLDGVEMQVRIFRSLPDTVAPGLAIASLNLERESTLDPRRQEVVQLSTGWYAASLELPPGAYIAIFQASNLGHAICASNPAGAVDGNIDTNPLEPIPNFSRMVKRRFEVTK